MIPVSKPYFSRKEVEAIRRVMDSGWVVQGPKVAEFERKVAATVGADYAVATTSCTTALYTSLLLCGVGPGDEVIAPSLTFAASVNSVLFTGARPVLVDIDEDTYNIDANLLEEKISYRTKVIMPVHQIGLPADLETIYKVARKHRIRVLEDAACALGAEYKGRKIGSFGLTCFSFHPRKAITTAEGGMITTQKRTLAERARRIRSHGETLPAVLRHTEKRIRIERYVEAGWNFRMTDIQAAMGLVQLSRLAFILRRREALANRYTKMIASSRLSDVVVPPFVPSYARHAFQSYMVRLPEYDRVERDKLMQRLLDGGIATRRGIMAVHLEPYFMKMFGRLKLPMTEQVSASSLILPLYPQMTVREQDFVVDRLTKYV